jgi:predicted porin
VFRDWKLVSGSRALLAGALVFSAGPALAADLGGNCCADLEERIAELEETTARKGNRKVSLTVSGWVNEAVFFWDDGVEQNTYVGTNALEQDRFRFVGKAKIGDGWSAGYVLEIGVYGANSKSFSQDSSGTGGTSLRKSNWYIKNDKLGKVAVGRDGTATYHLIDNVNTLLTRNASDYEAAGVAIGNFKIRVDGNFVGGTTWKNIMGGFNNATPGQSGLRNVVRYDTPSIAGFVATASWGEDDEWDVALRYKGGIGDFKINGSVGYGESTDPDVNGGQCSGSIGTGRCQYWGVGGLAQHQPTGLFVYGGYGSNKVDLTPAEAAAGADDESTTAYVQAGIERKWLPLGKTNIFGEYRHDEVGLTSKSDSADLDMWAAGTVQEIAAADMVLYAFYRNYSGEFADGGAAQDLDDFQMVITGAKIKF